MEMHQLTGTPIIDIERKWAWEVDRFGNEFFEGFYFGSLLISRKLSVDGLAE